MGIIVLGYRSQRMGFINIIEREIVRAGAWGAQARTLRKESHGVGNAQEDDLLVQGGNGNGEKLFFEPELGRGLEGCVDGKRKMECEAEAWKFRDGFSSKGGAKIASSAGKTDGLGER